MSSTIPWIVPATPAIDASIPQAKPTCGTIHVNPEIAKKRPAIAQTYPPSKRNQIGVLFGSSRGIALQLAADFNF